ncbi:hypothetical protein [Evansella clarkii]|uniref:hypothetical protein n=1 Tax=Evansella clarkii TaxID=79879 RepID=UPI0009987F1A|nr:hypothetical protein [Evansella clarkii]
MPELRQRRTFNAKGYLGAEQIVRDIQEKGVSAKISETWWDYGAGIRTETILVYSKKLKMWYQALNPIDFEELNQGKIPSAYDRIMSQAVRASA